LCHSLFLPPLMRFLHIIIVYNWIEILPMRGCCCVHVEDVTWAPTDGLFIFRCSELDTRMYSDLFGLRETCTETRCLYMRRAMLLEIVRSKYKYIYMYTCIGI
jgi:hypothetical protein